MFDGLAAKYRSDTLVIRAVDYLVYPNKGFNHHQAMKCYAEVFCPSADFILHTDSDCMFTAPVTPDDYFVNGKPALIKHSYENLRLLQDGAAHWQIPTERALGLKVTYEVMRRHPAVHPAFIYPELRKHIEGIHHTPFTDYVLKQQNTYPQGFSEFNALGAYALANYSEEYHWIDSEFEEQPTPKLHQFWSWHPKGISADVEKMEAILK